MHRAWCVQCTEVCSAQVILQTCMFEATGVPWFHTGSPPATGTGTLVIVLEDENDNAPDVYPPVAHVCEDAKDLNVLVLGGQDRDTDPNGAPFSIQLGTQPGLETTWNITSINGM